MDTQKNRLNDILMTILLSTQNICVARAFSLSLSPFYMCNHISVLLDFSLTVKVATFIFISGCGSAISSAKEGKSGFIYNLVKS